MKSRAVWHHFWNIAGSVSIRTKIMGIVVTLVLGLGIFMGWYIPHSETIYLRKQLDERGLIVARSIAALGQNMVLTNNQFGLYMLARNTIGNNKDIIYVFVTDALGEPLIHTFDGGFPADLLRINPKVSDDTDHIVPLLTEQGRIRDVAVPILGGRAGTVHVGMDETVVLDYSTHHTRYILLVTGIVLLLGILFAYGLATVLTRPISDLELATKMVSSNDFRWKAPIWARDEIGRLGISFNEMMNKIAESTGEIIRKNRELTTLNAVSEAMTRSLNLKDVLPIAMKKTLEGLELKTGWLFLLNSQSWKLELFYQEGISPVIFTPQLTCDLAEHLEGKILDNGGGIRIEKLSPDKLPSVSAALAKEGLTFLAIVSLKASQRPLGVMVIAKGSSKGFSPEDIRLLNVIGDQIGVAMENTLLWEALKHKENLRTQLLAKVISAQEEERKRIARELHDQTGQSITSLLIGLKVAKEAKDSIEMKRRIDELRALASNTLEGVRNLSLELRPSTLDDIGLVPALDRYIKDYAQKTGLAIQFQTTGSKSQRLLPEVETAIYRVVQEALTNVVRHANAKNVSVILEYSKGKVLAIVEDDGIGFDLDRVLSGQNQKEALGLYGMEERVSLIGGKLTIESAPGRGTTVYTEIPLGETKL